MTVRDNAFGGLSEVRVEACVRDGRTRVRHASFTAPFKLLPPFQEDGFARQMILSASAGIMAGDRQHIEVAADPGARLIVTSQAFEKVHKMDGRHAERHAVLHAADGAFLQYEPLPVIPFAGSDFRSRTDVYLETGSRFVFSEILCCGRAARGERFEYRRFRNLVRVYRSGMPVYIDNTDFIPSRDEMEGPGMFEGFTHAGTALFFGFDSEQLLAEFRQLFESAGGCECAVTRTASGDIAVRLFGYTADKLQRMIAEASRIAGDQLKM